MIVMSKPEGPMPLALEIEAMPFVVRLLDGPLTPMPCVSQMAYGRCVCEDETTCGLRLAMLDVRNAIADILDQTTLADVSTRVERAQRSDKRPARRTAKSASARKPPKR